MVASLLYADNGLPVEKTNEEETPLLASYDGIEFASHDGPSKLLDGRASFKLKISQVLKEIGEVWDSETSLWYLLLSQQSKMIWFS